MCNSVLQFIIQFAREAEIMAVQHEVCVRAVRAAVWHAIAFWDEDVIAIPAAILGSFLWHGLTTS